MINSTQAQQIDDAISAVRAAKTTLYNLRNADFMAYESDINGDWGKLLRASEACTRLCREIEQLKVDLIGNDPMTAETDDADGDEAMDDYDDDDEEDNMTGEAGFHDGPFLATLPEALFDAIDQHRMDIDTDSEDAA